LTDTVLAKAAIVTVSADPGVLTGEPLPPVQPVQVPGAFQLPPAAADTQLAAHAVESWLRPTKKTVETSNLAGHFMLFPCASAFVAVELAPGDGGKVVNGINAAAARNLQPEHVSLFPPSKSAAYFIQAGMNRIVSF
jgi:hypothetical protein